MTLRLSKLATLEEHDHQDSLGRKLLMNRAQELREQNKILIEPPGHAKMSAIIVDFARPLLALDPEQEYFEDAIAVAIIAWNIALVREFMPEATVDKLLEDAIGAEANDPDGEIFREQIAMLVRRKQKHFGKHRRFIQDYEITLSEGIFHVNILSELI